MIDESIIDHAKVARTAIKHDASMVGLLLTTQWRKSICYQDLMSTYDWY